jgi:hypothetical protein
MSATKTARNVGISITVLLLLLVGGGVGYTYLFGSDDSLDAASISLPKQPAEPQLKTVKPAENAKIGASVETLTSPVAQGENAAINIRTLATAKCTISVVYNNVAATDSGLAPKTADAYGLVTWTWTVDKAAATGTWPVWVTCSYRDKQAKVKGDLLVQAAGAAPTASSTP